jgi:heat shock protein HslJ
MKKMLVLTLLLVGLAACSGGGAGAAVPEGQWLLVSMPGHAVITETVTLMFDPARQTLSGNAGCNSYSGGYSVQGSRLTIDENMTMTLMACPDRDWNEGEYLQLLSTASGLAIWDNRLILTVEGGEMVFTPIQ